MNILRTVCWVVVLSAAALAGPNLPAQFLAAFREFVGLVARRVWPGPFVRMS